MNQIQIKQTKRSTAEISEIANRKYRKNQQTKSWFFENINKIDRWLKRKKERKEDTNY